MPICIHILKLPGGCLNNIVQQRRASANHMLSARAQHTLSVTFTGNSRRTICRLVRHVAQRHTQIWYRAFVPQPLTAAKNPRHIRYIYRAIACMMLAQHIGRSTVQTMQRTCIANRVRGGVCAAQLVSLHSTTPARPFASRSAQVHNAYRDQLGYS